MSYASNLLHKYAILALYKDLVKIPGSWYFELNSGCLWLSFPDEVAINLLCVYSCHGRLDLKRDTKLIGYQKQNL